MESSSGINTIDFKNYIDLISPNFYRYWSASDGKVDGVVIGHQREKYTIWSVLYIHNKEKKTFFPPKSNSGFCRPITGEAYEELLKKMTENKVC